MGEKFGVRQPQCVRSPTATEGLSRKLTRPGGRASDTLTAVLIVCLMLGPSTLAQRRSSTTITIDTSGPVNRFNPSHAIGAAVDGHEKGINDLQLKPDNIKAMLSAGLKPLTYRLRSELAMAVWHWNPKGLWSNQDRRD